MPNIRDAIALIEQDGWVLTRTVGSHRQYKHPNKPGIVTIAGHPSKDLAPGTWNSILNSFQGETYISSLSTASTPSLPVHGEGEGGGSRAPVPAICPPL
jgi:predicted RNA binding protein YcfA (HicA-like mRNA interferase family)